MKRFLFLFGSLAFCVIVIDSLGFDSRAEKEDLFNPLRSELAYAALVVDASAAVLDADLLSPAFVSNFNRLVEFPELGSASLLVGYKRAIRGPPKSQTGIITVTRPLRFSITERTRYR